jgi:hypothetical protein
MGKVGLAVGAIAVAFLTLEATFRVLLPLPRPVLFRDGIYVNPLPLVNGRQDRALVDLLRGSPLPHEAKPQELRVVMLGESSVVGSPWGYDGSPATFLWHQLRFLYPDRPITVINMGRASSYTMDAYYYLLSVRAYEPDVVVFYLGFNDRYDADREMCMPASGPALHALWRWLVARSHLAWTIRARGPEWLLRSSSPATVQGTRGGVHCDPGEAFQGWTDILVKTAVETGAAVVVATPLRNPFNALDRRVVRLEEGEAVDELFRGDGAWYAGLVACALQEGCDIEDKALQLSDLDSGESLARERALDSKEWALRRNAWIQSAHTHGAELVDFAMEFYEEQGSDSEDRLYVLDEVHLSLDGYWLLATLIAEAIQRCTSPLVPQSAPLDRWLPPRFREDIDRRIGHDHPNGIQRTALHHSLRYLGTGRLLFAIPVLQILERQGNSQAARVLAWLRVNTGNPGPHDIDETSSSLSRVPLTELLQEARR